MILVDTSVWIDHLRSGDAGLVRLLENDQVLTHPFVVGELAFGNLNQRKIVLEALGALPKATMATDAEVLHFIDEKVLFGRGIGYVDAHLLAATQLYSGARLWTRDKRLHELTLSLRLAATGPI